jgi:transposase
MPTDYSSKTLDHLGLVAGMYDELCIGEKIDQIIPQDMSMRKVSIGQAVKAMVVNGLGFANHRLYLVPRFFENKPTERLIGKGILPEHLNDDTLGRALDALFETGPTEIFSILSQEAVNRLGFKSPKFGHLDTTSFHVDGRYDNEQESDEGVIQITPGYSRDHRPDLNQVGLELIVESKAGLPLLMRPLSGNTSDKTAFNQFIKEYIGQFEPVQNVLYLVADSALYTANNLLASEAQNQKWITRVPETLKEAKRAIAQDKVENTVKVDDNYSYSPLNVTYAGIEQRWIVVESEHARKRVIHTVDRQILKGSMVEEKMFAKLCRQTFACIPDAEQAFKDFQSHLKYLKFEKAEIVSVPHYAKKGRPKQEQTPDRIDYFVSGYPIVLIEDRLKIITRKSRFILATNELDSSALSLMDLLKAYKGQGKVERGFRFLKDPLFLSSSIFLKSPQRIMALMMVMTLCLLVYAALEYRIRQGLNEKDIFLPDQKGKPTKGPTARWIFQTFEGIHLLIIKDLQCVVLNMSEYHQRVLTLLGKRYGTIYS